MDHFTAPSSIKGTKLATLTLLALKASTLCVERWASVHELNLTNNMGAIDKTHHITYVSPVAQLGRVQGPMAKFFPPHWAQRFVSSVLPRLAENTRHTALFFR